MRFWFGKRRLWRALLAGVGCVGLTLPAARGQDPEHLPAPARQGPGAAHPHCPAPMPPGAPSAPRAEEPRPERPRPEQPTAPTTPRTEGFTPPEASFDVAAFGAEGGAAVGGPGFTGTGYIDSAIPLTQYRLRFDSAYDNNRPDRAEFFYPKCGCFRQAGIDPNAKGPPLDERRVDYQEVWNSIEIAPSERFSAFLEVPIRFINPEVNNNSAGLSDITFGAKYAVIYDPCQVLTVQLRTYAPTGDGDRGLGTEHWSLEPALLYWRRLSENLFLEAELRDWFAVDSDTDYAGNVLRYGLGLSYLVIDQTTFRVAPVAEFVGWTVLDGRVTAEGMSVDADGDTIVNAKLGVRIGFGEPIEPGLLNRADLYIGYGRALTGHVWYEDMYRTEFRIRF